jgi:hypothetical protein
MLSYFPFRGTPDIEQDDGNSNVSEHRYTSSQRPAPFQYLELGFGGCSPFLGV